MKTAEEWANKINIDVLPALTIPILASTVVNMVKQIQLDAMKEGMRRAAEIAKIDSHAQWHNILTTAEQLTEKDII